jgi:c-di-GMP-binding flagellar brake protein YcgR
MTDERRRHARKTVQDRAVIHRQAAADPARSTLYCTTVDISAAGLQLKLKQALEAGERIDIVIHVPGHKDSFHLRGETRWAAPAKQEKSFLLGIQIEGNDSESPDLSAWRKLFDKG